MSLLLMQCHIIMTQDFDMTKNKNSKEKKGHSIQMFLLLMQCHIIMTQDFDTDTLLMYVGADEKPFFL